MRKLSVFFLLGLIIIIINACNQDDLLHSKKNFAKLYWLEGNWKGNLNKGIYHESWRKESDDSLSGHSYFIEGNDTIISEAAKIKKGFTNVIYSVKVGDKDEVEFSLVEITDAFFIFENKQHDFPQRIIYIKKDKDTLLARIEGMNDGKTVYEEFRLTRQK